jgi:predicted CDP-diglyceride synthetase/phosphatidate cytidylyltransferase
MKRETKIVVVKTAVTLVTGVAVAAVATAAIKNIVPMTDLTKFNKVIYGIGTFVISSIIAEAGMNYAGAIVDGVFTTANQVTQNINPQ